MNALTKFQGGQIQLTEAEALIMAEMQDDTAAFDMKPTIIKVAPGGVGQFVMGDEMKKGFNAVVAISQKVRGYWPEKGTGKAPLCSSPDGSIAIFDKNAGDDRLRAAGGARIPHPALILMDEHKPLPDTFSCSSCPLSEWGSEHQGGMGKGKACKEMRRLLLLIDGWSLPAILSLPPTSIKPWDTYCSALQSKRSSYFAVRTKFALDSAKALSGETYNLVQVSALESIADMESLKLVTEIRRQYRELVVTMPVTADEYDIGASEGTPQPATDLDFDADGRPIAPF